MKNAVLFVPHPDDELLVGGGMLYALAHSADWCVKVVFVTNGDYYAHEAEIRLNEAINACMVLGMEEKNVIFLGYGDRWKDKHIYNSENICVSNAGFTNTYALKFHPEYAYQKRGQHNTYTKEHIKDDIKAVIENVFPDVLICVDFDLHPDHRAVSLLFTEAVHEILISNKHYFPLILKKLAYEGVMRGQPDYYHMPHLRTVNIGNDLASTPVLKWNNRICFKTPSEVDCTKLTQNPIFKAATVYKSQRIKLRMISALNSDIVFWRLPSENSALQAKIEVSSGIGKYINDLKIIDSNDINQKYCNLDCAVWKPDEEDIKKSVKMLWENEISINLIVFFENPNPNFNINKIKIVLNNEKQIIVSNIEHDGAANIVYMDKTENISTLEFLIIDGNCGCGLTEIMTFDKIRKTDEFMLPCKILDNNEYITKQKTSVIALINYIYFKVITALTICWPNKYVLMRNYQICRAKQYMIPVFRVYHCFKRGTELLIKRKR